VDPWPADALIHEMYSLRKWLLSYPLAPRTVAAREIEGDFERPMIRITPLTNRVQNLGRFRFNMVRTCTITFFGSTEESGKDLHAEAYGAGDWMARIFGRDGAYQGPVVRIYDFSTSPEIPTTGWIFFDTNTITVSIRQDQYGLWTVPADVTYRVEHGEEFEFPNWPQVPDSEDDPDSVVPGPDPQPLPAPSPLITIKRKVETP
jgi:hypothetical protein